MFKCTHSKYHGRTQLCGGNRFGGWVGTPLEMTYCSPDVRLASKIIDDHTPGRVVGVDMRFGAAMV